MNILALTERPKTLKCCGCHLPASLLQNISRFPPKGSLDCSLEKQKVLFYHDRVSARSTSSVQLDHHVHLIAEDFLSFQILASLGSL